MFSMYQADYKWITKYKIFNGVQTPFKRQEVLKSHRSEIKFVEEC